MKSTTKLTILSAVSALAICAVLALPPIRQNPAYHQFADTRHQLGIPNFWNVASNLLFLPAAFFAWRQKGLTARATALAALSIAAGSACYHLHPTDETLFWDRLPMTLAFSTILAAAVSRSINRRAGEILLLPLAAAGLASVEFWRLTGDLRPYALMQFLPAVLLILMLVLFPASARAWWPVLTLYAAAKLFEHFDAAIWLALGGSISGHTLKHAAAAAALVAFSRIDPARVY